MNIGHLCRRIKHLVPDISTRISLTRQTMPMATSKFAATVTADDGKSDIAGIYMVIDLSGGSDASSYPVSYLNSQPCPIPDDYRTTKLAMRKIPAGTFTMGSPSDERGRNPDEKQHKVTITKDFYIGVFEVTQKHWERVMGNWPSWFNNTSYREVRPVEKVSYNDIRGSSAGAGWPRNSNVDATSFMGKLRQKTGIEAFDLPTEAQWEYACRAGITSALNNGTNVTSTTTQDVNLNLLGRYWYDGGSEYSQNCGLVNGTAKVGSYLPNAWGLYDMHGNDMEWCLDWYNKSYPETVTDPTGSVSGYARVIRGGSWYNFVKYCRSASRNNYSDSSDRRNRVGFRLLRTLP